MVVDVTSEPAGPLVIGDAAHQVEVTGQASNVAGVRSQKFLLQEMWNLEENKWN